MNFESYCVIGAGSKNIVGAASALGGAVLAFAVTPDNLPIVFGAIGTGIGIGWAIIGAGKDRRVLTLSKEMDTLQKILENKDLELEEVRMGRRKLYIENEVMAAKIAAMLIEKEASHARVQLLEEGRRDDAQKSI